MPSHSKKQHNFMEAIAHSPSFAKKIGVPQSVGKDYAAADKGKTFSNGGEMKESKGMVGKEVAFMKKKGAPKSMIKHEEAEIKGMKRGGKVRRMAGGGMGDPFERDTDYEAEKAQGAKNLEGIKSFFGFGKKKEEETRPMTMDKPSSGTGVNRPTSSKPTVSSASSSPIASTTEVKPPKTSPVKTPSVAQQMKDREKGGPNEGKNYAQGLASKPDYESYTYGPDYIEDKDVGKPREQSFKFAGNSKKAEEYRQSLMSENKPPVKRAKPVTVSETKETKSVTAAPAKGKVPAKIDSEKLLKDAEEEVLRKKPTAMTEQMRKAPTINDLYAGQKSMGEEIGDALKSFRESIRGGLQKGKERQESKGSTMYAKGGNVKRMRYGGEPDSGMDMGQPMRSARMNSGRGVPMQAMGPEMNPNSIAALQAKYGMRPQGGPPMKAGGSVKKMAEGGYAKADGVAKKGKTQPKMVKMASGGFVKNADGCAQRGKTKAFQVKMKRGGMC